MQELLTRLAETERGGLCAGFRLIKKEHVASVSAELYTLRHEKTGAELLYMDRADENKTFSVCFKTLPEDDTGVFHILEHSVLNGSERFPVKEPFVSLLQGSMQTFLNAMTFSDKTLYPVCSRSEQDLFNLMSVYLDAVFRPLIYTTPEIFMQEGWHYAFDPEGGAPYYNGVVFSEMKGAFSDVDRLIGAELNRLLYPDNSYGHVSGGDPAHIPELTYAQFVAAHKRFYHPSNAKFFLDGHMDIDTVLAYIDTEYLSKFEYRAPDFDFIPQTPKAAEKTVCYAAQEGEPALAHMALAKLFCEHGDAQTLCAAEILADYLTGSNEAPLKRAFLERGLAQDVTLDVTDGVYQPNIALIVRNADPQQLSAIRAFVPETVQALVQAGLDRQALSASLERLAFRSREITEPYGLTLSVKALDGWLYGDDPLTYIDTAATFASLREKLNGDYFPRLLLALLGDAQDKCCLYVLPSAAKGEEDERREAERLHAAVASWSAEKRAEVEAAFEKMQRWQQAADTAEALATLPHLRLEDIPLEVAPTETALTKCGGTDVLQVVSKTNGIVYLNLYFDVSDFTAEELRMLTVLTSCFGELSTKGCPAAQLQTRVKAAMGALSARVEVCSERGKLDDCRPQLLVSASMLEENAPAAIALLRELLLGGRYDETGRIYEIVQQSDYFMKQSLISAGHMYALSKALSAFSAEGAMRETLTGESAVRWLSAFAADFERRATEHAETLTALAARAFAKNRLFVGYSGSLAPSLLSELIDALPEAELGAPAAYPRYDTAPCGVDILSDVSYCAMGHNLYALGGEFTGAWSVLASLVSYGYLWGAVRVQGGAYGTGMGVRATGDIFCYSYRDPNPEATANAFGGIAAFLDSFCAQELPLDDLIIGTVNTTEPLLDPAGVCTLECHKFLNRAKPDSVAKLRREILSTSRDDLRKMREILQRYAGSAKLCAVGSKAAVAFVGCPAAT